jgi:hypothetical protein
MEFHSLRTAYQWAKSMRQTDAKSHAAYAHDMIITMEQRALELYGKELRHVDPFTPTMMIAEAEWAELRMPYYNLWPGIISALTKLRLDIECDFFKLPMTPLLVRFPKSCDHPLKWSCDGKEWSIRYMMVSERMLLPDRAFDKRHNIPATEIPALSFWLDIGEEVEPGDPQFSRRLYKHLLKYPGWTIERSFEEIPAHESISIGVEYPRQIIEDCARIACTLCLMAADPELVVPDVLAKDKAKFADTNDPALVERAHNRGKVGWDVGHNVEIAPHLRSSSPAALYWTGVGRKVPRIRFRKGCIVHRKRLSEVPTGFLANELGLTQEGKHEA